MFGLFNKKSPAHRLQNTLKAAKVSLVLATCYF